LIALRRAHPNLRRRKFFQDRSIRHDNAVDILWLRADGEEMTEEEWGAGWVKSLGLYLNGARVGDLDGEGNEIHDDSFLLLLNSHVEPLEFVLPALPDIAGWQAVVDTPRGIAGDGGATFEAHGRVPLERQSLMLLRANR
jgi:glycogen operon protein